MTMRKLSDSEMAALATQLPHWQLDAQAGTLTRQFVFADFVEAFAFMTRVAPAAEKHNHHPEWSKRVQPGQRHLDHARCARLKHQRHRPGLLCERFAQESRRGAD